MQVGLTEQWAGSIVEASTTHKEKQMQTTQTTKTVGAKAANVASEAMTAVAAAMIAALFIVDWTVLL